MKIKKRYVFLLLILLISVIFQYFCSSNNARILKKCNYEKISDNDVIISFTSFNNDHKFYKKSKDSDIMVTILKKELPFNFLYIGCETLNVSNTLKDKRFFYFETSQIDVGIYTYFIQGDHNIKKGDPIIKCEVIEDRFGDKYTIFYTTEMINNIENILK